MPFYLLLAFSCVQSVICWQSVPATVNVIGSTNNAPFGAPVVTNQIYDVYCGEGNYIGEISCSKRLYLTNYCAIACYNIETNRLFNYFNTYINAFTSSTYQPDFPSEDSNYFTPGNLRTGITALKISWDQQGIHGGYFKLATQTVFYLTPIATPFTPDPRNNQQGEKTFDCAQYGKKIVGAYGYFKVAEVIYSMGVYCGYVHCVPGIDNDPSTCSCKPGEAQNGLTCTTCPSGTYTDTYTSPSCIPCQVGAISASQPNVFTGATWLSGSGTQSATACSVSCNAGYAFTSNQYCTPCNPGYYKPTSGNALSCTPCPAGTASTSAGATTCTSCLPTDSTPHYQDQPGRSICNLCTPRTAAVNYYIQPCTSVADSYSRLCNACLAGSQLATPCVQGNTLTASPFCFPCPAGTFQSQNSIPGATCTTCVVGKYTSSTGSAGCVDCTVAPTNGFYVTPTTAQATSSLCPYACNTGWYAVDRTCSKCGMGQYAQNSVCKTCTPSPINSYLLRPDVFAGTADACPWDCNAGFYKQNLACIPCNIGFYASALALRTSDQQTTPNQCIACITCTIDTTYNPSNSFYQSSPCTTTTNRICTSCSTTCSAGFYVGQCTTLSNTQCIPCKTTCNNGFYMTGSCSGLLSYDSITCTACTSYTTCRPGTFLLPNQCPGTTYSNVYCVRCTDLSCAAGYYEQDCNATQDKRCVQYTQCPAGKYLSGRSATSDGTCTTCTNCTKSSLSTLLTCSAYVDSVCGGVRCNQSNPCPKNYFCNPIGSTCGRCPDGYSGDGLTCLPCPPLYTCDILGNIQCIGEVQIGYEPGCYGRYVSGKGTCPYNLTQNIIPIHSTFVNPGGKCLPYFDCQPGFYRLFSATGTLTCDLCTNTPPTGWKFFSQGLTPNAPTSCLLECAQLSQWPAGTCSYTLLPTSNQEGFYADTTPCDPGKTSQPQSALVASDCLSCPSFPNMLGDPCGSWQCNGVDLQRRGDKCYSISLCPSTIGYYQDINGICIPMILPFQPQGNQRLGTTVSFSSSNGKQLNTTSFSLQGQICSAAFKSTYTFITFCNQSFISFVDTRYTPLRPRLLIGNTTQGYQEGFRDSALFRSQLFIALDPTGTNLYVADTLNQLIRVVEFTTPGLYTTRSHALSATLDYPGRILPILDNRYFLFPTQSALYMLDDATRTIQVMLTLSSFPPSTNLYLLTYAYASSPLLLTLSFPNASLTLSAIYQSCPAGLTSPMGGQCTTPCPSTGSYVDGNGTCTRCTQTICRINQLTVPCSPFQDQTCTTCPPIPTSTIYTRIYNTPGSCSLLDTSYVAPCPPDTYLSATLVQGLPTCQPCPSYSSTASDGAVSR